jgi:hypothetical protein
MLYLKYMKKMMYGCPTLTQYPRSATGYDSIEVPLSMPTQAWQNGSGTAPFEEKHSFQLE